MIQDLRVTYATGPDDLGRYRYDLEWTDPEGPFRTQKSNHDENPVGHRRGQCFNGVPKPEAMALIREMKAKS